MDVSVANSAVANSAIASSAIASSAIASSAIASSAIASSAGTGTAGHESAAEPAGADSSPEWAALLLATEESASAGKARSALGGYVPIGHPGHPSKWSAARQDALADANANVGTRPKPYGSRLWPTSAVPLRPTEGFPAPR